MPAKGDNDRLALDGQDRRPWFYRTRRQIGRRCPSFPPGDRLLIDPMTLGQNPQALVTMLYRSKDCLSRAGASVKNLAHSASFHSLEKIAPPKPGTKHAKANAAKSKVRARVEHVFAYQKATMGLFIPNIGIRRAKAG